MIRLTLTPPRRRELASLLDGGDGLPGVTAILDTPGDRILVPVTYARALAQWLHELHVAYGIGLPSSLVDLQARILHLLRALDTHPAMYGHGELGWKNTVPFSVWATGGQAPGRLYEIVPGGVEGYLVPTRQRFGPDRLSCTAWEFAPMPHGGPRSDAEMFDPIFGTTRKEERDGIASREAATAEVRAEVLRLYREG